MASSDKATVKEVAVEVKRSQYTIYNWVRWGLLERDEAGLISIAEAKRVRSYLKYNRRYGPQQSETPRFSRRGKTQIPKQFLERIKKTINP